MRKDGQARIREQLGRYVVSLKEEYSQGLILPTKSTAAVSPPVASVPKVISSTPAPSHSTKSSQPGPLETQDVKIQETFSCSKVDLFRTFCDIDRVKAFTHNSVSHYDCKQGGFFSLLSDNITGRFLKIEPYDRIDMLWRFKSWPSDHYSHVSLLFQEKAGQTKLIVQQTGVPVHFYENTRVCLERMPSATHVNSIAKCSRTDGNASIWTASNQRSVMDLVRSSIRCFTVRSPYLFESSRTTSQNKAKSDKSIKGPWGETHGHCRIRYAATGLKV